MGAGRIGGSTASSTAQAPESPQAGEGGQEGGGEKAGGEKEDRQKEDGSEAEREILGDAARLGGVFGIDFADHAVTAVALGGIEAGIGAFDQRIRVVARLEYGDADRDRDPAENFAGGFLLQF